MVKIGGSGVSIGGVKIVRANHMLVPFSMACQEFPDEAKMELVKRFHPNFFGPEEAWIQNLVGLQFGWQKSNGTVDGRNPPPPGMYKTL